MDPGPGAPRIGALVPPENPTVGSELSVLLPRDAQVHLAPLPVLPGTLRDRLLGYNESLTATAATLRAARCDVTYFACTGSSYLVGPDRDGELDNAIEAARAGQSLTAARAILETLAELNRRRVLVISPYPGWLTDLAVAFWTAAGLEVTGAEKVPAPNGIYAITPGEVAELLRGLRPDPDTVVLLSGTGMPTIEAIVEVGAGLGAPIISSSLAAAYRALRRIAPADPEAPCLADDLVGRWL